VAWFILKCTLDYPQKLAGKKRALPDFITGNESFMDAFYKANPDAEGKGKATKKQKGSLFASVDATHGPDADLAWHVRAWGQWVLSRVRTELAALYPTYADFEPLKKEQIAYEHRPMTLVPLTRNGTPDINSMNAELSKDYLAVQANPRWIAKPTVAYLWARTVQCKNCRAQLPLLKTRWLCKTDRRRVLLTMAPKEDKRGVVFGIQADIPSQGGNAAQKREHDKRIAGGTMSRAGAKCPCCPTIMTMEDIRVEGKAGKLGSVMTAVVLDTADGKAYRMPTLHEIEVAAPEETTVQKAFEGVPFGVPEEPTPSAEALGMRVPLYGFDKWRKLFTSRQLMALGRIIAATRQARPEMVNLGYTPEWVEAVTAYLACGLDRTLDFANCGVQWKIDVPTINHSFVRFALPITWDYAEGNLLWPGAGGYIMCLDRIATALDTFVRWNIDAPSPHVVNQSSTNPLAGKYDVVLTDPPYYDAIPYSDLMDFFYVWLRRTLAGTDAIYDSPFKQNLSPKWDHNANDGELIDDSSRHGNNGAKSKQVYEDGMARVFVQCAESLVPEGRLVIVFANKQPAAWETLVSAIIRAGFTVDGTWPIQTEQSSRMRAQSSAALASSVWLVCKKREVAARVGWDTAVLEEMRSNIAVKLQTYWDAGIRGPDFIWAATGPALEAYSKHPAVKKADQPGQVMTVAEFLNHVRRLVVDYVVGKVLTGEHERAAQFSASDRLDEPTAYYLLHRHDFGLNEAPVGTCILYAVSCSLSDSELVQTWDILAKTGADDTNDDDEVSALEDSEEESEPTGGKVRLKAWTQRKNRSMGYEAPNGRSVPLIDRVHRLMHLWKAGDVHKVDEYLDEHGMRRHELFKRLVQSLIELSERGSDERSLLESLSNHIGAKGTRANADQMKLALGEEP
jgi:adenine-specific DNA methylase